MSDTGVVLFSIVIGLLMSLIFRKEDQAEAAAKELGIDYQIEKMTNVDTITDMG